MKPLVFKFWEDLLYYDGPLLSLCITEDRTYVLLSWIDKSDDYHQYAYIHVSKDSVESLLREEKSYYQTLKESEKIITWKYNKEKEYFDFELALLDNYMEKYGPRESLAGDELDYCQEVKQAYEEYNDKLKGKNEH